MASRKQDKYISTVHGADTDCLQSLLEIHWPDILITDDISTSDYMSVSVKSASELSR